MTVLHVLNVPLPVMPPAGIAVAETASVPPLRQEEVLEEVRRFTVSTSGADQSAADVVVVEGNPVREILRHAEDGRTDLLVMGTHGRGGFAHLLLGSVAERIVRTATCPVLTVRGVATARESEPLLAEGVMAAGGVI